MSNFVNRTLSAIAVQISVINVATIINFPILYLNNPFSVKTEYTTAMLVSDSAVLVNSEEFNPQPMIK